MTISDQKYRDLLNTRAQGLATIAELRGEGAGIIAAQRHDPSVQKMVKELSQKTGEPVDEIMDRILDGVREKLLPKAGPITTGTTEPNAAVAAYRAKLDGSD